VLQELDLDPQELADQGRDRPRASVRRLGFLLERAGKEVGLGSLQELAHPGTSRTLLDPAGPKYGDVDRRWSVIVNTTVEPEG
jgi:predicted transcriptional regulator of viral defense system